MYTRNWPLTTILGPLTGIPSLTAARLQRWALLLSAHSYDIRYHKGHSHYNADGLARLPLPVTKPESNTVGIFFFRELEKAPVSAVQVKKKICNYPEISEVMDINVKGQPAGDRVHLKPYLGRRLELSVQSGWLLWGRRLIFIIILSLCPKMLQQRHSGHSGIEGMKEMARSYYWWPGKDKRTEEIATTCSSRHKIRNNPPLAPLHPWEFPQEPWHCVHVDFAGPLENRMFLVTVVK